jgi:hypothetical protein
VNVKGLSLALLLLVPTNAFAQTKLVPIVFDRLVAQRSGATLTIQYRVAADSWRMFESDRVTPQVHLQVKNADRGAPVSMTFERELSRAEDAITFDLPPSLGKLSSELWVTGGHRGMHISWMDFRGVEAERIALRVGTSEQPPPPPPGPNWAGEPRIIAACGDAFDGTTNEKACLDIVKKSANDPTGLIASCEALMDGDASELECLRVLIAVRFEHSAMVRTCDEIMDGDTNELECLRAGVAYSQDPTATMRACDSARSGDTEELGCIRDGTR